AFDLADASLELQRQQDRRRPPRGESTPFDDIVHGHGFVTDHVEHGRFTVIGIRTVPSGVLGVDGMLTPPLSDDRPHALAPAGGGVPGANCETTAPPSSIRAASRRFSGG